MKVTSLLVVNHWKSPSNSWAHCRVNIFSGCWESGKKDWEQRTNFLVHSVMFIFSYGVSHCLVVFLIKML